MEEFFALESLVVIAVVTTAGGFVISSFIFVIIVVKLVMVSFFVVPYVIICTSVKVVKGIIARDFVVAPSSTAALGVIVVR